MNPTIISYDSFRNKVSILLIEQNNASNPNALLNFLVKLYAELAGTNFSNNSLDELFQIIQDSLKKEDTLSKVNIHISNLSNLFNARKNFREIFQKKEFANINGSDLLEEILFLQITELITEIENGDNFNKWENLSINKYIEAGISGLIDSQSLQDGLMTPILVCAFIEFGKSYE